MNDFSKYRLNSISEMDDFAKRIGYEKFYKYQESVFAVCAGLKPGDRYFIAQNVRPENIEAFIKCACFYMFRDRGNCNILFSDDLTYLKGVKSFNQDRKEWEEYQAQVRYMRKGTFYEKE